MKTVEDVELQVQTKVTEVLKEVGLLPDGYRCRVRLHGKKRVKKRTASFATSWSPDSDSINIQFKLAEEQPEENGVANTRATAILVQGNAIASAASPSDPLTDLVRALDRVES